MPTGTRVRLPSARAAFAALLLAALACGAGAAGAAGLYEVSTIVTGQREETRATGFARCLEAVLVKVSGDPRLIGDPRVAAMVGDAGAFVEAFRYRDRLAGIPVHDEQGTRDRPFDLTVGFDPARIDAALRSLGRGKWPEPRPRVAVFLRVDNGTARYLLAADGQRGHDQREALAAAADQLGVPLVVPTGAALAGAGATLGTVTAAGAADLEAAARKVGGDAALAGELVWSERDLGWVARWRLAARGGTSDWRIGGVSFDDAFRNAVRGAAQVLSGNGAP